MDNVTAYRIPTEIVRAALGYLASKPYTEVADLIAAIQNNAEPCIDEPQPTHEGSDQTVSE